MATGHRRQRAVECAWAVAKVLEKIQAEAAVAGLEFHTIEIEAGPEGPTIHSALIAIAGAGANSFSTSWRGTIRWIARSPFRPEHKRKNWFVGIELLEPVEETVFHAGDVKWETMRASGPGGQHVNRTESGRARDTPADGSPGKCHGGAIPASQPQTGAGKARPEIGRRRREAPG